MASEAIGMEMFDLAETLRQKHGARGVAIILALDGRSITFQVGDMDAATEEGDEEE